MSSSGYQVVISHGLLPFWRRNRDENFIFMQDNAPVHVSRSSRAFFSRHQIPLLALAGEQSRPKPDGKRVGFHCPRIYASNAHFENVRELKKAIVEAWHQVDEKLIENLYRSMDNRIFQVIQRNGGPVDY
ncbi:hypothetical protein OSTOST_04789 [Ostertagia ostertagi]